MEQGLRAWRVGCIRKYYKEVPQWLLSASAFAASLVVFRHDTNLALYIRPCTVDSLRELKPLAGDLNDEQCKLERLGKLHVAGDNKLQT